MFVEGRGGIGLNFSPVQRGLRRCCEGIERAKGCYVSILP